jgi:hypothetical protein
MVDILVIIHIKGNLIKAANGSRFDLAMVAGAF